jgi:hypothetical protein
MTIWDRLPIPTVKGPHPFYPLLPDNGHHPQPTPPAPPGGMPAQPTTPPPPRRRRLRDGRGWAYIGMLAGLAASIAANVAHAFVPPTHTPPDWHPPVGAIVSAVVWPAFLFAALEILVRTTWQAGWRWRLLRFAGLLPVAGMAALVSYLHMRALLRFYGEDRVVAAFGPIAVDGLMVMATAALMATSPRRQPDEVKHRKPAPGDPPARVPQPVEQPRHAASPSPSRRLPRTPLAHRTGWNRPTRRRSNGRTRTRPSRSRCPATRRYSTCWTGRPGTIPGDGDRRSPWFGRSRVVGSTGRGACARRTSGSLASNP